ncbi:MAG: hypothetical protein JXR34_09005 [Bacteroidales bacterium]|nr:hypothetical protein [Bacteroidales bacterium]
MLVVIEVFRVAFQWWRGIGRFRQVVHLAETAANELDGANAWKVKELGITFLERISNF